MKYAFFVFLFCSFSLTILSAENPWRLYKEYPQYTKKNPSSPKEDVKVVAAYFNHQGKSVSISNEGTFNIIELQSPFHENKEINNHRIVCLNQTEKFLILNGSPTGNMIAAVYWPYSNKTNKYAQLKSCLPITPNRFKTRIDQLNEQEIVGLTYEPTPENNMSNGLIIQDIFAGKEMVNYYHPQRIVDFCFHQSTHIVASITAEPKPTLFILHADKHHNFYMQEYPQQLYSVRFDETGNRLVVVSENIIEIFDTTNFGAIKSLYSFNNAEHTNQACLSEKYLALASSSGIKLIDITTKNTIMECAGYNNDSAPMNCFDNTGNFFMIFKDNKVSIYTKTDTPTSNSMLSALPQRAVRQNHHKALLSDREDTCCDCSHIEKMVASICVFFQNNFFNC